MSHCRHRCVIASRVCTTCIATRQTGQGLGGVCFGCWLTPRYLRAIDRGSIKDFYGGGFNAVQNKSGPRVGDKRRPAKSAVTVGNGGMFAVTVAGLTRDDLQRSLDYSISPGSASVDRRRFSNCRLRASASCSQTSAICSSWSRWAGGAERAISRHSAACRK